MNFDKLPAETMTNVMKHTQPSTIRKLSTTNSRINAIIKRGKLDKIDKMEVSFWYQPGGVLKMFLVDISDNYDESCIQRTFQMKEVEDSNVQRKEIYQTIKNVYGSVGTVGWVEFSGLKLDAAFFSMLQELSLEWSTVSAQFNRCHYDLPWDQLMLLWKLFETIEDFDGTFRDKKCEMIDDEMLQDIFPLITMDTMNDEATVDLERNERITDKTLALLAKTKPKVFIMESVIVNYTTKGVKELFTTIIGLRTQTFLTWNIGNIELKLEEYNSFLEDLREFETVYSQVYVDKTWSEKVSKVTVSNHLQNCYLSVGLVKPAEILRMEAIENELWEEHLEQQAQEYEEWIEWQRENAGM